MKKHEKNSFSADIITPMNSDINDLSYDENMRLQAFRKAEEYYGIQCYLKTASEINEGQGTKGSL